MQTVLKGRFTRVVRRFTAVAVFCAFLTTFTPAWQAAWAEQVTVRAGKHAAYTRIVFDWQKMVGYTAAAENGAITLTFNAAAEANLNAVNTARLSQIGGISADTADGRLVVRIDVPAGAKYRDFRIVRKIVVDVYGANSRVADAKTVPAGAAPRPEAPEPETADSAQTVQTPTPKPDDIADADASDTADAEMEQQVAEIKAGIGVNAETPPEMPAVAVDRVEAEQLPPEEPATTENADMEDEQAQTVITISTVEPAALAVFERAGYLWLVLDTEYASIPPERFGPLAAAFGKPESIPVQGGAAWRMRSPGEGFYRIRRDSLSWQVALTKNPPSVSSNAPLRPEFDTNNRNARLIAGMQETSPKTVRVQDPVVGDELVVVTSTRDGQRLYTQRRIPGLEILPAWQGAVFRPVREDLKFTVRRDGVIITAPGGLHMTPGAGHLPELLTSMKEKNGRSADGAVRGRLFDIISWQAGGIPKLRENRRALENELLFTKPGPGRAAVLIRLAMLHFANSLAHEALGYLRLAATDDPKIVNNPSFLALRGAARALSGHYDEAIGDLSTPALQNQKEASLWRGFAAANTEQWKMAARSFPTSNRILTDYPSDMAVPFTIFMAESALRVGNTAQARSLLDTLEAFSSGLPQRHRAALSYLTGEAYRQEGELETAIRIWDRTALSRDRLYHTKASLALTKLLLELDRITVEEAIEKLDTLRFAWRGDGLEVQILHTLGRLLVRNGQYKEGLTTMRTAVELAEGNLDDSGPIMSDMSDAFTDLYVQERADELSPLEAIAVFDEFRELLPPGADGDTAVRNFAEYLVQLDLLDRASQLLEDLLAEHGRDVEGARIGARLASIHLLDHEPRKALATLDRTKVTGMDAALKTERDLLRARALSETGAVQRAIATLSPYGSRDAMLLKADIQWRADNWADASDTLSRLLPDPSDTLTEEEAELVLNTAVALKLAARTDALNALKSRYTVAMADTQSAAAFDVVTREAGLSSLSDRETLMNVAAEVDVFRRFLDNYRAHRGGS